MRLIWVKAGKLLPVDTGGKIRSYNILRHLAKEHDVALLSYYLGERDVAYERALAEQFPNASCVAVPMGAGKIAQGLHYLPRFLFNRAPYSVTKYTSPSVTTRLRELIATHRPDVMVCDFLAASLNFGNWHDVPCVLFQHNVESALWERQARFERHPLKRPVFGIEAGKMLRYETDALARFDGIIAVSEHDASLMRAMNSRTPITVVRTGVDVEQFTRRPGSPDTAPGRVMFLGSMDWPANIDGVEWFATDIWPRVLERVPGATFHVVGRNPPPRITRLASRSVVIAGGVESVLPSLHAAEIFVVPLRIGGGTRLKIYEAMGAALPIVSTRVGAEGLDVSDGEDILLRDDADAFGEAVVDLLTDPQRRASLARSAHATASRFDWSVIARQFADALRTVLPAAKSTSVA